MPMFMYAAWFRDSTKEVGDPDHEWPACFMVDAPDADQALAWGDHLATRFSRRLGTELFLKSSIVEAGLAAGDLSTLPVVAFGHDASDEEIGW